MRNHFLRAGTFLVLLLTASCEKQESSEGIQPNYFTTNDLSFLLEDLPGKSARGWPANGCKDIDVKIKLGFFETETTVTHCCVDYVCNLMAVNQVIDFFLGNKSGPDDPEIEIISSGFINFKRYDIRIHPGRYQLDSKTHGLRNLKYEVWVKP